MANGNFVLRQLRKVTMAFVVAVALPVALAGPAAGTADASPKPPSGHDRRGAVAVFDGRAVNLAKGWDGAQACNVLSRTEVRCYATRQQADAAIGLASSPSGFTDVNGVLVPDCAYDWICIYEHIDGGGRRLLFSDEYWHDLYDYGFNDQLSSYRNRQDPHEDGWLYSDGDGDYMYRIEPWSYVSYVGHYNDRADWIWG